MLILVNVQTPEGQYPSEDSADQKTTADFETGFARSTNQKNTAKAKNKNGRKQATTGKENQILNHKVRSSRGPPTY
jgi:hypothetical protein